MMLCVVLLRGVVVVVFLDGVFRGCFRKNSSFNCWKTVVVMAV